MLELFRGGKHPLKKERKGNEVTGLGVTVLLTVEKKT